MLIGWLTNALFGEKIERFNISQFYVIEIAHRVQMIIDIAEITTKELFFCHSTIITIMVPFSW